jgi:hypothetical protein
VRSNPEELRGVDGTESYLGQVRMGAKWLLDGLELERGHTPILLRTLSEGKHRLPDEPPLDGGSPSSRS